MKRMAEEWSVGIRWAFKFGSWNPSKDQWIRAVQSVQAEEKERLGKFMFQKDVKSSIVCVVLLLSFVTYKANV